VTTPTFELTNKGNVLMLAKGQNGVHDNFSLHEGILRLEVGRPVYERLGLMGKPIDSHGRKHKKSRYGNDTSNPTNHNNPNFPSD